MIGETASFRPAAGAVPRAPLPMRVLPLLQRYGLSTGGPLATSAAHFIASLILLRNLPPASFGLFSFVLIVVPFCLSLSGALIGAPFIADLRRTGSIGEGSLATHLKANVAVAALAAIAVAGATIASGADPATGLILGAYGAAMTLRLFGRTYAYASGRPSRALFSDLAYAFILVAGLAGLLFSHALTMAHVAAVLAVAAVLCFGAFGPAYARRQIWPGDAGTLGAYAGQWRDLARWAVVGVVLTEFTANAHAYVVTFVAGPRAFALLAVGALMMRPASLVLSSLPDIERPRIAAKIGKGEIAGAFRNVREFRMAAAAVWIGTLVFDAGLLLWFPGLLLKKGYDGDHALIVIAIWGVILAVRTLRTPEAVFMQAAGEFRALASVSLWASIAALSITLGLLLAFGPIAALGGILAGDLVMTVRIFALTRTWRLRHG